jgi:hypothetical protein
VSTVFFPLRTSVELFADPTSPTAVTKAKEAAVLFERLIFEQGLLDVTISPGGSWQMCEPPEHLTPEKLQKTREPIPLGSNFYIAVGDEQERGVPADTMHVMVSGKVSARYIAEFHTGILDDLERLAPDWLETVILGSGDPPRREPVGRAIAELNFADLGARELMPDKENFLRSWIYKGFNHDLVSAGALEATFSISPLFEPMLERRGLATQHAGDQALAIIVPNIGGLPWDAVADFREHPGSQEARAMLREFEQFAAAEGPDDAYEFLLKVSQKVTRAYAAALAETAKSLPEELAKEALLTGVSLIPAVGQVVASASSVSQALRDVMKDRRSWSAALWKLRTAAQQG